MDSINYLRVIKGERLQGTTCEINDSQVILSEPKTIEISIWRNDERDKEKFEIQIHMPWGNLYTIARCESEEKAEEEFKKIVKQTKNGQAKIKIGKSLSVMLS